MDNSFPMQFLRILHKLTSFEATIGAGRRVLKEKKCQYQKYSEQSTSRVFVLEIFLEIFFEWIPCIGRTWNHFSCTHFCCKVNQLATVCKGMKVVITDESMTHRHTWRYIWWYIWWYIWRYIWRYTWWYIWRYDWMSWRSINTENCLHMLTVDSWTQDWNLRDKTTQDSIPAFSSKAQVKEKCFINTTFCFPYFLLSILSAFYTFCSLFHNTKSRF